MTRKDGMPQAGGHEPVDEADDDGDAHGDEEGQLQGHAGLVDERPHEHGREAEDRADREVELAGRHEQGHGQRDHAQLRREHQQVAEVAGRQVRGGQEREDDERQDEQPEGPGLRLRDGALEPLDEARRCGWPSGVLRWCCFGHVWLRVQSAALLRRRAGSGGARGRRGSAGLCLSRSTCDRREAAGRDRRRRLAGSGCPGRSGPCPPRTARRRGCRTRAGCRWLRRWRG